MLRSREELGPFDRAFLEEAFRQRSAQERVDRAARDRAAMLAQVTAVASRRMQEQLEATRSQANQKWAQRVQVGKFARLVRTFLLPRGETINSAVGGRSWICV